DVFGQRFNPSGARLGDNFRMSDSAAAGDQSYSSLHINPSGIALVTWDDRRFGLTGDIFAQFFSPDGSPLGDNFRVNDDAVGLANQYSPSVSGDDSGRFAVVWMDGRGRNPYDWNIFLQRFGPDRNRLGSNVQVTTDESIQWSPRIGVGRSGRAVVVWDDRRAGHWDIYAQLYSENGAPIGANFRVNDDAGTSDQFAADAAINVYDEFLIVWTDRRSGDEDVYARRFDRSGNALGPGFVVSDINANNQAIPSVAACPDGGYWVAWVDSRSGDYDVYCRRLARDGTPVAPSFRVNDDEASSLQRVSSIGMDSRGWSCVVWEDERADATDIYRAVFDDTGQMIGPNLKVNDDGAPGAQQYYAAAAGGTNRFVTAWTDNRLDWDIYGQFLDGTGQLVGTNFRVNSDALGTSQWYPYCAMDSSNNSAIAWMDYRLATTQVFIRRFDPTGNPVGEEFPVSDTNATAIYGSIAMSRNGWLVAAWMDYRDGESDIYCQAFRPDGTRVGPNIKVNDPIANTYNGYPSCAVRNDGSYVVAWEDNRNENYDVYLQWFDSTGHRLGGNERVPDGRIDADYYSPSCALAPEGRLAVLYNDERDFPGNPQIYCQLFNPDRSRLGRSQRINQPNLFPKNHHWTVGQSIAASSERVAFAWTDNRRHQGWDIVAKLTNWELVAVTEPGLSRQVTRPSPVHLHGPARNPVRFTVRGPAIVRIFDAAGRQLSTLNVAQNSEQLELNRLAPGAYFVLLRSTQASSVCKIVVE
ncbi:MAG: T9SS type A sorting domain-containing protein, partial [candidate division WOR-3 bacterium]